MGLISRCSWQLFFLVIYKDICLLNSHTISLSRSLFPLRNKSQLVSHTAIHIQSDVIRDANWESLKHYNFFFYGSRGCLKSLY